MNDVSLKTPLGNRLLVRRVAPPTTRGGIYLPESARDDANTGGPKEFLVLAVGPGRMNAKGVRIPIECRPGDRVVCHSYTSGPVPVNDTDHIITEDQILAVIPAYDANSNQKTADQVPAEPVAGA